MKQRSTLILFLFILLFLPEARSQKASGTSNRLPAGYALSEQETKLYNLINEYRAGYNLAPIPLSLSLSYVASTHVKDLFINHPDQAPCNFHSRSNKGPWKPFCYPRDEKKGNSVWDKPKELTGYKGKGFEIIYWENNAVNTDSIIPFWSTIDYFNSFLLNTGKWQDKKWMAIGVGVYQNYAAAWFGDVSESEEPTQQVQETLPPAPDTTVKKATEKKKPVEKRSKSTIAPPVVKTENVQQEGKFYIIVSSMQPKEKSGKLVAELIAKGYPDAKVLTNSGKFRVSIAEVEGKSKADSTLREVKKIYKDAWILK
ncbi:MAG: SPOR domain-containing protein [Bacteroidota bacterium]